MAGFCFKSFICYCLLLIFSHGLLLNDPDFAARMQQLELTVQTLQGEIQTLKNEKINEQGRGAIYTRWGRKDCPGNGTEMVYSGTVGGGWWDTYGSPADYLCLPHDPDFIPGDSSPGGDDWVSKLYGSEYDNGNYFGTNVHDQDVPCAVCKATKQTNILMIPGKTSCYTGWKQEYYGRMAAGADIDKAASQYICVDVHVQTVEAGKDNRNGKLLFGVKAVCGSLHCPPFYDNAPISCVVCSS